MKLNPTPINDSYRLFSQMRELFEETNVDFLEAEDLLVEIWKESKDPRIEAFFSERGGIMIDGVFMFYSHR